MTPDQAHYGQIDAVYAERQHTLSQASRENPNRFVINPLVKYVTLEVQAA